MSSGQRLWGGRFVGGTDPRIDQLTKSFRFDRRLAPYDLLASIAHVRMLGERGVLEATEASSIETELFGLLGALDAGELAIEGDDEDVHTWIERQLTERLGPTGGRLHTARSRNDQTAVALRLLVRASLLDLHRGVTTLQATLVEMAESSLEVWLPGYTHLQRGQPVSLAHHLLAHFWFLDADADRLERCHRLAGVNPLGAGALAGTLHDIDPARSAELLGLESCFHNSMHAVADRDYVVEAAFACSLLMVHLSRWAEEVVLWTSSEVGFAKLGDGVAKGSSIMPQKRNPEPAEVLRGKSGRAIGDLTALLVQLKGLPLTYNSDLQEDKEALFDALDTAAVSLDAAEALLRGLTFDHQAMGRALEGGYVTATDLADGLVARGVPFREAHHQVGQVVRRAEERGVELWRLTPDDVADCCPEADAELLASLTPEASVRGHDSPGGPAPARVEQQLAAATASLGEHARWRQEQKPPPLWRELFGDPAPESPVTEETGATEETER